MLVGNKSNSFELVRSGPRPWFCLLAKFARLERPLRSGKVIHS